MSTPLAVLAALVEAALVHLPAAEGAPPRALLVAGVAIALAGLPHARGDQRARPPVGLLLLAPPFALGLRLDLAAGSALADLAPPLAAGAAIAVLLATAARRGAGTTAAAVLWTVAMPLAAALAWVQEDLAAQPPPAAWRALVDASPLVWIGRCILQGAGTASPWPPLLVAIALLALACAGERDRATAAGGPAEGPDSARSRGADGGGAGR